MPHSTADGAQDEVRLLASLTSLSPLALGDDARHLIEAGVDGIHVDIGDGHFVPFLTFGLTLISSLADSVEARIEVHLMVDDPEAWIAEVAKLRVARVWFHLEATRHPWRVASLIRGAGMQAGLAVNAATPIAVLQTLGRAVDAVNLLGTDHDFRSGDPQLDGTIERVRAARAILGQAIRLEVDGGVDATNAAALVRAGADDLVVGRAICGRPDWTSAVQELRVSIAAASNMRTRRGSRGESGST
jgi:ribulose-phosphate 3-epimerase